MAVPPGVPPVDEIEVSGGPADLQNMIATTDGRYNPQSLCYSTITAKLYMLQALEAGDTGDLILNQYTKTSGTWGLTGHMTLNGFGHGIAFGICDRGDGHDYFFMDCNADSNGRGTAITFFEWSPGSTYTNEGPITWSFTLGTDPSCALDTVNNYIAIRYKTSGAYYYQAFITTDFLGNGGPAATKLLDPPLPEFPGDSMAGSTNSFQGFAVSGGYLYTLSQTGIPQGPGHFRSYFFNAPNPTMGYYDQVASIPASTAPTDPGEFEGLATFPVGKLAYMVTSGGGSPTHHFNLHTKG